MSLAKLLLRLRKIRHEGQNALMSVQYIIFHPGILTISTVLAMSAYEL